MPFVVPIPEDNATGLSAVEMLERVRRTLRDENKDFFDDDEIIDELNIACLDIAARTRSIRRETNGTFLGLATFGVPDDFLEPQGFRITPVTDTMTPYEPQFVDDTVWYSYVDQVTTSSLIKPICRYFTPTGVGSGQIETYPTPSDGDTYQLRYVARPALLTMADPGQVSDLPPTLCIKAVQYARGACKLKANEIFAAEIYMSQYNQDLPQFDVNAPYTMPGPWQMVNEGGPFDTWEAKHI